jgi:hypothetical protein
MIRQQLIIGLLFAAASFWAAGCNSSSSSTIDASSGAPRQMAPVVELVAQFRPPIPDLPLPVGFDLDQSRSRNFAAAGMRWVDHRYEGGNDKFAVARFYRRQMPINRWTLVTEMFTQGDLTLDFEKQTERCHIVVSDGNLIHPTIIKVQLWTSGRVQTPVGVPEENRYEPTR